MTNSHPDRETNRWLDVLAGRAEPEAVDDELAAGARRAHLAERDAFMLNASGAARNIRLQNMLEARIAQTRAKECTPSSASVGPRTQSASASGGAGAGQGGGAGSGAMAWGRLAAAVSVGVAAALFFGLRGGGSSPEPDPVWQAKGGKVATAASSPVSSQTAVALQVVGSAQPEADALALKQELDEAGYRATVRSDADGVWVLEGEGGAGSTDSAVRVLEARGLAWPTAGPLQVRFIRM